jgi:hypothetical protein
MIWLCPTHEIAKKSFIVNLSRFNLSKDSFSPTIEQAFKRIRRQTQANLAVASKSKGSDDLILVGVDG